MTATYNEISSWFDIAKKNGARYLVVGLDPFDHDNFPCYCKDEAEAKKKLTELITSGNNYDEIYDTELDKLTQLNEHRAKHLPGLDECVREAFANLARKSVA